MCIRDSIIPGSALLDVERLCADSDEEVLLNVGTKHSLSLIHI